MNGVYSYAKEHCPKEGLTISTPVAINAETVVTGFSMGAKTDISAETYDVPVIYLGICGTGTLCLPQKNCVMKMKAEDICILHRKTLCRTETENGFVYMEIMPKEDLEMNKAVKAGEVFQLADLLPYEKGSIVNMDVASNEGMKFVVMAFDENTALSPHRAPNDALLFALEGTAKIGYEGREYTIGAGETFHFEKNGLHSVTAQEKFKMALLLTLK